MCVWGQREWREEKPIEFYFHFQHKHILEWVIYFVGVTCSTVLSLVLLSVVLSEFLMHIFNSGLDKPLNSYF